jgi:NADH:ubiquinone oxidoreductase subunit 6 (subunit J)
MQRGPAALVSILLLAVLVVAIYFTPWPVQEQSIENTTGEIGRALMTGYLLPFELISVLLLGVLVAAAKMARKEGGR